MYISFDNTTTYSFGINIGLSSKDALQDPQSGLTWSSGGFWQIGNTNNGQSNGSATIETLLMHQKRLYYPHWI